MKKLPIGSRLLSIIKKLGYNPSSFSKAIGIDNNVTINRLVKGEREPSFDVLNKITERFPCINTNWLLKGEGDPFVLNYPIENCDEDCLKSCQKTDEKLLPELLPGLLPNDKNGVKKGNENYQVNYQVDYQVDQKTEQKTPYPGEVREQDPVPYKRTAESCQTCHANERVIAALQAHINTLERELHRQQVINDEIQGRDTGQKRKVG